MNQKHNKGFLLVGSKVIMKNNQIARYLGFNEEEKEKFEKKVADYCYSIQAINKKYYRRWKTKDWSVCSIRQGRNAQSTRTF